MQMALETKVFVHNLSSENSDGLTSRKIPSVCSEIFSYLSDKHNQLRLINKLRHNGHKARSTLAGQNSSYSDLLSTRSSRGRSNMHLISEYVNVKKLK